MKALAPFRVVLLDMNRTFMFGEDRFGPDEDFAATYRNMGGKEQDDDAVNQAVRACVASMTVIYEDPERSDSFPQVIDTVRQLPETEGWSEVEIQRLDRVITRHELGTVPPAYAALLKRMAVTHELGVVSNIWGNKTLWLEEMERAGIRVLFKSLIFSSDSTSIKPSPRLFEDALLSFDVERSEVVFIGDDLQRDIAAAQAVGLATIWIRGNQPPSDLPDRVITDLLDLDA
ncbi:MAG TPA: HAD-IA family hydrolase [Rhodothermales bacterium]|nr:HAD-IA family hydrolase [Rhodothermales bacterium]